MNFEPPTLPYPDTKPVGAADFYFAINATFRFIHRRLGMEGLKKYWSELGANYFMPVTELWKKRDLAGVAEYWRAFFAAEPGAEVQVNEATDSVTLNVKFCPAFRHLREQGREIFPCYCQHCYFVSEAIAAPAGLTLRVTGGNGSCRQIFFRRKNGAPEQKLSDITEAT